MNFDLLFNREEINKLVKTIKAEKENIHKDFQHIAKQLAKYKAAYKKLKSKYKNSQAEIQSLTSQL